MKTLAVEVFYDAISNPKWPQCNGSTSRLFEAIQASQVYNNLDAYCFFLLTSFASFKNVLFHLSASDAAFVFSFIGLMLIYSDNREKRKLQLNFQQFLKASCAFKVSIIRVST